jgi:hypothetical protein
MYFSNLCLLKTDLALNAYSLAIPFKTGEKELQTAIKFLTVLNLAVL